METGASADDWLVPCTPSRKRLGHERRSEEGPSAGWATDDPAAMTEAMHMSITVTNGHALVDHACIFGINGRILQMELNTCGE
jgi:hypothetical protein